MAQAQLMYLGTNQGVVLLSNPGRTDRWLTIGRELLEQEIRAIACTSDAPMNALAATASSVFSTADGGVQWSQAADAPPIDQPATSYRFPGQPPAMLRINAEGLLERAESADGWTPVLLEAQGAITVLCAPAYHQDTAYCGTDQGELWESSDRGRTWLRLKRDLPAIAAITVGRIL